MTCFVFEFMYKPESFTVEWVHTFLKMLFPNLPLLMFLYRAVINKILQTVFRAREIIGYAFRCSCACPTMRKVGE